MIVNKKSWPPVRLALLGFYRRPFAFAERKLKSNFETIFKRNMATSKPFRGLIVFCLFILFSCSGCGNNSQADSKPGRDKWDAALTVGSVIDSVPCPDFPKLSYALFLPVSYNPAKKYPCIYFFDSHGNGALPLRRYKNLANEFGFVLIGSNLSRNGMAWQEVNGGITEMMEDSRRRIHIDSSRIYTGGFSGGAKVASSAAIFNGGIAGVIACAGGFPPVEQEIQTHFDYFGIVGELDFNLSGLEILHEKLGEFGFSQQLLTSGGKHTWADTSDFRTALLWMQVQAMRKGSIKRNDATVMALKSDFDNRIEIARKATDLLKVRSLLIGIAQVLDTFAKTDDYRKEIAGMQGNPEMMAAVARRVQLRHNEVSLQDTLSKEYTERDLSWWHTKIAELNLNIRTAEVKDEALMYSRVVNYLGMVGYISTTRALKMGNMEQAANCLKIFRMADPGNPDCAYLSALYFLKNGKPADAMKSLEEAARLGYSETYQLLVNPEFSAIQKDPEFSKILAQVLLNAKNS